MTKTITLPSGKVATIHRGVGFDLLQAQTKAKTPEEIPYALIAELAEIDGNKLVYEDILQMDLEDVITLQGEISGKFDRKTSTPATTSPSEEENQKAQIFTPSPTVNPSSTYVKSQDGNIQK